MNSNIFIFLLCINTHLCTAQGVLEVLEVFQFGIDLYNFFDNIFGGGKYNAPTPAPIDYERIIREISDQIDMFTAAAILQTEIEAQLADVRRSSSSISQLLGDILQIINAKTRIKRQANKREFLRDFEQEKNNLYSLKTLLTLTVPEISSSLLRLIVTKVNCGMTSLEKFQTYYMHLVSNAVGIDLVYERLNDNVLYDDKLDAWKYAVAKIIDEFEKEKNNCKNNFLRLARDDFDSINEPGLLFDNNQKRFSYMQNDVLVMGGSYCAKYLKNYSNIFRKQDPRGNVIVAAFGGNDNVASFSEAQFDRILKMHYDQCQETEETQSMIYLIDVLEYDVVFLLMYPESKANNFQILLDNNTTANVGVIKQNSETYTTIIYVRHKTMNSTKLHANDYEVYFKDTKVSAACSLFDKMWIFNVVVFITRYYV